MGTRDLWAEERELELYVKRAICAVSHIFKKARQSLRLTCFYVAILIGLEFFFSSSDYSKTQLISDEVLFSVISQLCNKNKLR